MRSLDSLEKKYAEHFYQISEFFSNLNQEIFFKRGLLADAPATVAE